MTNQALSTINKFIEEKGVVILDGGFSNQLSTYNYDYEKSDLWTASVLLDKPDLIKKVHLDYLNAGSDVITTVTYQATFQKLRERNLTDQHIHELFRKSLECAEEAIDEYMINYEKENKIKKNIRPLIAISIGSYGAYQGNGNEYRGDYDLDENGLIDFHRERIDFIATKLSNKKNLIAIETIPNFVEAKALVKLLRQYDDLNAWISFSIKHETECISDGTPIVELVKLIQDVKQIFAIGINCLQPEDCEKILKKLKEANSNKFIVIYPNNGDIYDAKTRSFIPNSAKFDWIDKIVEWKNNYDLKIIGGCCGIGANDIKRIRSLFI